MCVCMCVHRLKICEKENNELKKQLPVQKSLKTKAENKLKKLHALLTRQRAALDKLQSDQKVIKSDQKVIAVYRAEIARVVALRKERDHLVKR